MMTSWICGPIAAAGAVEGTAWVAVGVMHNFGLLLFCLSGKGHLLILICIRLLFIEYYEFGHTTRLTYCFSHTIVGKYAISDAPPVFMSLSCDLEQHLNSKNFKHK